eukprot:scaffold8197_cov175-Alexandrium_tamarense.AAC.2
MVKFSFLALAGALAASTATAKTIKLGNRNLRRGEPATEALLKRAQPYKKAGTTSSPRKLEEEEIDGSYSLKFSQCLDVKTYNEENFETYASYLAAGTVTSSKSYVLFHVCQGNNCFYESEQDLYIVDLATYLATVAVYHAEQKMNYCDACEQFQDVCVVAEEEVAEEEAADAQEGEENNMEEGQEGQEGGQEGQEGEGQEGEGKILSRTFVFVKHHVMCTNLTIFSLQQLVFRPGGRRTQADQPSCRVSEFIKKISECEASGSQWNGIDLYYGAICSPYGDGVELAVFVDEDCTMYTTEKSFNNVYNPYANGENYNYLTYAENYIKTAFSDTMSCLEPEYVAYGQEADENQAQEEERYEINEYCQQILQDDAMDYSNGCEANEDEEQQQGEQQQEKVVNGYYYDVNFDGEGDINEVCAAVKKMESEGSAFYHAYNEEKSGSWYTRDKKGQIINASQQGSSSGLSGGAIFGIIALIATVVGGAAFVMLKKKSKKGDIAESAEYQGGALS